MSWESQPVATDDDFLIYSIPDYPTHFHIKRASLIAGSETFRDMFDVCDGHGPQQSKMDLSETADVLQILIRLLDNPIEPYIPEKNDENEDLPPVISHDEAIPFPLLRQLFELADKYLFTPPLVATLQSHLVAHEATLPLQVYALATALGYPTIAARASAHLHSPPMHTYSPTALNILPSIESLQLLYILQAERVQSLRQILAREEVFPYGYGICHVNGHTERVKQTWLSKKKHLLMGRIEAGTDVASEMATALGSFNDCETCKVAFVRAVEMLRYKCRKVPKKISKITIPS